MVNNKNEKKAVKRRQGLTSLILCAAVLSIGLMGFYFRAVSQWIYDDSTNHLVEVYSQVNNTFGSFLERNWGNLNDWVHHIQLEDGEGVSAYISGRQAYWGFSAFYFLAPDGSYMMPDGSTGRLTLDGALDRLFQEGENVMANETLSTGQTVTIFAVPVSEGSCRGFDYTAIGISYTNADMIRSLDVDAFSGQSRCFVVCDDGRVLLSTQSGGSVFGNYLSYLRAGAGLDEEELERLRGDWENGVSGVVRCEIGGEGCYIAYQPVGYQDCVLLGVVPEQAASASLLKIQKATADVLVKVFLLFGAVVVLWLVRRSRRQSQQSQMELQYREMLFNTLSISVDDIFIMLDKENLHVDYISPNVERLLGVAPEAVAADVRMLAEDQWDPITIGQLMSIPVCGSLQWEREHTHRHTGEQRWYRETAYRENIQGMEKIIIVMADHTQERRMNQNLQEALEAARSANEAKSAFLANMSHDIRTPMNAVIGFSILLAKDAENPEKVREYIRKISASSQHLLNLINDVLDMSKIESGSTSLHSAPFSLSELLEDLYAILLPQAKAKSHTFEVHTRGRLPESLLGDKLRLNQILLNLLSNAVKYTPDGGQIDFTVQELPQTSSQYACLRFTVQDNGIGMSEEFLQTIFDPFSRESNSTTSGIQGTGLGMAITKNLVDLMGGVIEVDSRQGQGSTFTVELSFALPSAQQTLEALRKCEAGAPRQQPEEDCSLEGLMFLVAEDNELNAEILSEMLDMEGARCELASNGRKALEMFMQSPPDQYDMILMDVQMPVMDGYEATRQIRACGHPRAESVPIVAMTANAFAEDVKNALDAGMNGHLAKPIDMDAVRALLGSLRKAAGGADAVDEKG